MFHTLFRIGIQKHNFIENKGFNLNYKPGVFVYTKKFENKSDAIKREEFLKYG